MSRRTRRPPVKTAASPEDVLHVPALAGTVASPASEPEPAPLAHIEGKTVAGMVDGLVGFAGGRGPVGPPGEPGAPSEIFGGKGDHDANGKVGGAKRPEPSPQPVESREAHAARVPQLTPEQQAMIDQVANSENPPVREKTLHELNLEARQIDRWHAQKREEAQAMAKETLEPMLKGVLRPRQVSRRVQKNLRAPVKE